MANGCPTSTREAVEIYSASQVKGATPGQLILQTYDHIIACCRKGDQFQAKKGVVELMSSLNLDYQDISGPLFRLYEYCLDVLREQRFEEAIEILSELRDTWTQVLDQVESGAAALKSETTAR